MQRPVNFMASLFILCIVAPVSLKLTFLCKMEANSPHCFVEGKSPNPNLDLDIPEDQDKNGIIILNTSKDGSFSRVPPVYFREMVKEVTPSKESKNNALASCDACDNPSNCLKRFIAKTADDVDDISFGNKYIQCGQPQTKTLDQMKACEYGRIKPVRMVNLGTVTHNMAHFMTLMVENCNGEKQKWYLEGPGGDVPLQFYRIQKEDGCSNLIWNFNGVYVKDITLAQIVDSDGNTSWDAPVKWIESLGPSIPNKCPGSMVLKLAPSAEDFEKYRITEYRRNGGGGCRGT